jgi:DNA-binding transcriptional regulator YiaG
MLCRGIVISMEEDDEPILSPEQSRAGRGLLNWSQDDLAESAKVGNSTVRDFEARRTDPRGTSLLAMRAALERAGVELLNHGQPGARLVGKKTAAGKRKV